MIFLNPSSFLSMQETLRKGKQLDMLSFESHSKSSCRKELYIRGRSSTQKWEGSL